MSGAWERNPVDVVIATLISGAELVFYEWHENMMANVTNMPKDMKILRARFPEPVVDVSRDKAVNVAIQSGAKWLWFVDSDILPPPDALARLMAHDKPIVSGLYVRRHNPPFNEMLRWKSGNLTPVQDGEYTPGSLVEVDCVATGCLLVRTDVFEKMKPFQVTIDGMPAAPSFFLWTASRLPHPMGLSEDFAFSTRAKAQGIPVYCDTSVQCKHMGPAKFVPSGNNTLALEFPGS